MERIEYNTPEELKLKTDQNRNAIQAIIKKLKKKKPKDLDDFVHDLHDEAFSNFSCLDCANCCKTIGPRLIPKDIERLAKGLKMKEAEFTAKYVSTDVDGDLVFNAHPCPFLMPDNYCLVYENRPRACRQYPHTNQNRFYQILKLSHKNCETCPVVFEIFDDIQKKYC